MATQRQNLQGLVSTMPGRVSAVRNDYRCSIERNQAGKYCVRIRVRYPRHAWLLGVFFLASNFDKAMKKLEESVDFLQRHEEKLWFWGVDRAEDMGFSAEFLREAGLWLDRRIEFPPKAPISPLLQNVPSPLSSSAPSAAAWPSPWKSLARSTPATNPHLTLCRGWLSARLASEASGLSLRSIC
jgi:hypothetical protein